MPTLPDSLMRWRAGSSDVHLDQTIDDPQRGVVLQTGVRDGSIASAPLPGSWTRAVPSWHVETPPETSIEVVLRAEIDGCWTRWYTMATLTADQRASSDGQRDADAEVQTDTLVLHAPATAIQWRVTLHGAEGVSPALRSFAVLQYAPEIVEPEHAKPDAAGPLPVPELSQMAYGEGRGWCSPTALTMLLAYWHRRTGQDQLARFTDPVAVPSIVVPAVYDEVYEGAGNWSFNVSYAASLGLEAYVVQLRDLGEAAEWIAAGVPLIASVAWEKGQLDHAPIARSSGHLTVIIGFTDDGDVIINEPACSIQPGESIRRVYRRDQFEAAWQHSQHIAYLIYPPGWIDERRAV